MADWSKVPSSARVDLRPDDPANKAAIQEWLERNVYADIERRFFECLQTGRRVDPEESQEGSG